MFKKKINSAVVPLTVLFILAFTSANLFAYGNGVAGRTLKPGSTPGCTCHQSALNSAVLVSVTGPATLIAGRLELIHFRFREVRVHSQPAELI